MQIIMIILSVRVVMAIIMSARVVMAIMSANKFKIAAAMMPAFLIQMQYSMFEAIIASILLAASNSTSSSSLLRLKPLNSARAL